MTARRRDDDLRALADHFGISLDPNEPTPPPRPSAARSPDNNNPFKPVPPPSSRRRKVLYRDPTANDALRNLPTDKRKPR